MSLPAQPLRVYFVGCESSGKTTLARWVAYRYGLPLVTEVARSVLAEMEIKLDVLRADIDLTNYFPLRLAPHRHAHRCLSSLLARPRSP